MRASAKCGTYRHNAFIMGHLPIPSKLLSCDLWNQYITPCEADLNEAAKRIAEENGRGLEQELSGALGLDDETYQAIIEYGEWLNEETGEEAAENKSSITREDGRGGNLSVI